MIDKPTYEELEQKNFQLEKDIEKYKKSFNDFLYNFDEIQLLAKIGHWELDLISNILTWSDEIYNIFGCNPQEFGATYEAFLNFIHPEDREFVNNSYLNHINSKEPYDIVHRILLSNGEIKYVNERCKSDFNEQGNPIRSIGIVADITDKIKSEEKLQLTKYSIDNITDGIFWIDKSANLIFVNKAACRNLEYSMEELLIMKIFDFDPVFPRDKWEEHWNEIFLRGSFTIETVHQTKSGRQYPVEITTNKVEFGGVQYNCAIARDITERKNAEEEQNKHKYFLECMDKINKVIRNSTDLEQLMHDAMEQVVSIFDCDRAYLLYACDPNSETWSVPMEYAKPEYPGVLALNLEVPTSNDVAETFRILLSNEGVVKFGPGTSNPLPADASERFGFKCFMSMAIYPKVGKPWQFGIHQCSHVRYWTTEEEKLMQEIGKRLADALTGLLIFRDLKESEEKFSSVFNYSPSALTIVSLKDFVYLDVNEKLLQLIGYKRDEIVGHSMSEINITANVEERKEILEIIKDKCSVQNFEYHFLRKDKSTGIGLTSVNWISIGGHPCVITQTIDITERKKAEILLKEKNDEYLSINEELKLRNNEYYALNEEYITVNKELKNSGDYNRMLFELSPIGLAMAKITGELVDINQAYADIIDYSIEEAMKLSYWDITPEKYAEQEQIQLKNLNEKGFYGPYEKEYINKYGKLIPVRLSGRIIEKKGEKFIWSSVENITIQKQFEEEIKQNELRLNTLFELSKQKTLPLKEVYNFILNKSIELCKSKIGFLGFVDKTEENIEIFAWSESVMNECTVQNSTINFVVSQSGLWAETIRQRKPIIVNDYNEPNILKKGFPSGHVKLNNLVCIPFFNNNKIVLVIALANKETDYSNTDIVQLNLLLDGMWTIIKERNYQSDLVVAKEKAEENEARLLTFINSIPDIVCYKDGSGRWLLANDADLELFCLQDINYLEKTDLDLSEFTNEIYKSAFITCMETDEKAWEKGTITNGIEIIPTIYGEEKVFDVYKVPVLYPNGERKGLAVIGREITKLHQTQINLIQAKEKAEENEEKLFIKNKEYEAINDELRQTNDELIFAKEKAEESDRLKTSFLQNISHEIRTPMNAIIGFSGFLDNPNLTVEKRKTFTTIIQKSTLQLLSIVTDILTISTLETKQEKLSVKPACINNTFADLLVLFNTQAINKNISLYTKLQLTDEQSEIYTDITKVTQILTNLITNALKFTHKGFIEFGYNLKNNELEFYVKDSGIGIKQEMLEKIFERFIQADETIHVDYGGTGLGLSISKGFVELLGGKIWVQSEPEKGSTFYFTIPYKPVHEVEKTNLIFKQNKNVDKIGKTILVAEDDEYNYLFIKELLTDMDIKLIHTKDGKETVEICKTNPYIDLIFMDIKMPIMDGHTAAKLIKEFRPDLTIIAQTAYALEHEKEKYKGTAFDDYITKPINKNELVQKIMKYIDKQNNK